MDTVRRTSRFRRLPALLLGAWILTAAACGGDDPAGPAGPSDPPDSVPNAELTFLRQAAAAPQLVTYDTTVVAIAGEQLDLEIRYLPLPGQDSGEKFLEFKLDDESLASYPPSHPTRPGQPFAAGDTVWIRVVVDPQLLIATMEPSGLTFDPLRPAELEIRYSNADDDYDNDGVSDPELEVEIDLWRQESPGDDWERSGDVKDLETDRIRAFLRGFSRYGLGI